MLTSIKSVLAKIKMETSFVRELVPFRMNQTTNPIYKRLWRGWVRRPQGFDSAMPLAFLLLSNLLLNHLKALGVGGSNNPLLFCKGLSVS
jgi:hypothetical protein